MSVTIDHYPNEEYYVSFFCYTKPFKVDINESIREKLGPEKLNNATILKILKEIKSKSDALSCFTRPIVFIPLSAVVLTVALIMPAAGIILAVAKIALLVLGGSMIGIAFREPASHFLSEVSKSYQQQSDRAVEYISKLEANPNGADLFRLAPEE